MRAFLRAAAFVAAGSAVLASGPGSAVPANPDAAAILHVLNRAGFGARPGDVERVRQIGLAAYIERQLHPEKIADTAMAARLAGFETLAKSSRELADDYFIPVQMARQQAKRDAARDGGTPDNPPDKPSLKGEQMGLARKQRAVLVDLSSQKILRAAYSERQLEEVMTDFWFNHFNVFANKGATQQ